MKSSKEKCKFLATQKTWFLGRAQRNELYTLLGSCFGPSMLFEQWSSLGTVVDY